MAVFTSCMPFQHIRSWRKASKCKKIMNQISYRLKFIQARKSVIVTQTRDDIEKLLKLGHFQLALKFVGELHREQTRIAAYEVINEICECISTNLSYISKKRELPNDVNVAVSSLVFAASRCGELPELNKLRNLFKKWYGSRFDAINVNLQPTNLVKPELNKTLSNDTISDNLKLELINEIIRDSSFTLNPPQNGQDDKCLINEAADRIVQDDLKLEYLIERRMNSTRQEVHEEKVRKMVQKPEASSYFDKDPSPRESTDSTSQIQEKEIVYLDDISGNTPPCHHDSRPQAQSQSSKTQTRRMPLCSNTSVQPLPQHTSNPIRNKPTQCTRRQSSVNAAFPVHKTRATRKLCQGSRGGVKECIHHQRKRPGSNEFMQRA